MRLQWATVSLCYRSGIPKRSGDLDSIEQRPCDINQKLRRVSLSVGRVAAQEPSGWSEYTELYSPLAQRLHVRTSVSYTMLLHPLWNFPLRSSVFSLLSPIVLTSNHLPQGSRRRCHFRIALDGSALPVTMPQRRICIYYHPLIAP